MLSAKPAGTILQRLRDATQPAHLALEQGLPLMRKNLSVKSYTQLLQRFYTLYVPLEAHIAQQSSALAKIGIDLCARRKSSWLQMDLQALDVSTESTSTLNLSSLPSVDTAWQAMGCLYVTEGATLGGQVIARHLRQQLGLDIRNGARFFASYEKQTGPMWKQYLAALSHCTADHATSDSVLAMDQVVAAATVLFTLFRTQLVLEVAL